MDDAAKAEPEDRARAFKFSVLTADRVLVETRNALGEYDVETFSPSEVCLALHSVEAQADEN